MKKTRMSKQTLLTIFLMAIVSSCSRTSISDDRGVKLDVVEKDDVVESDIVWEDLRIQKLMPGYMIFPAIEPYLPAHFIALPHPEDPDTVYWGDKDVLKAYFENGISHLKSAIIRVDISPNVAQKDENSFSEEYSEVDLASQGVMNSVSSKWKWGIHPVMRLRGTIDDEEVNIAWIGLNHGGQVLCAALIYPPNQHVPSEEDLNMWSDFLKKTKPLEEREFFKAHGQDLREGFTLVNVYGSVLRVSAEKRISDGKIQVIIMPEDNQISCKCLDVIQMLMEANWHFFEPIVKIKSRIQVISDANIIYDNIITVLLKKVSEFSNNKEGYNSNPLSRSEYDNISVFNFCERKLVMQEGVLQN